MQRRAKLGIELYMSRMASQIGLSLAAFTAMVALGIVGIWLLAVGIAFAGAALLTGIVIYLGWIAWRTRADHAWR